MASVHQVQRTKFWLASFRDASGKQYQRSTGLRNRKRAHKVALRWERQARQNGTQPVYCGWCRRHLSGPAVGFADITVSHGICQPCKRNLLKEAK